MFSPSPGLGVTFFYFLSLMLFSATGECGDAVSSVQCSHTHLTLGNFGSTNTFLMFLLFSQEAMGTSSILFHLMLGLQDSK